MISKWIKNKLGRSEETPATEQFYSPLRIGLHSTITFSTVDLLLLADKFHPNFSLPNGSLDVIAISTIDNREDQIFRIDVLDADENQYMIQIFMKTDPRSGEKVVGEAMFFQMISEEEPLTQEEWDATPDRLGATTLTIDDLEYSRTWGGEIDDVIDLFVFEEKVVSFKGETKYTSHQMLFGRELEGLNDETTTEFALIGVEEDEETDVILTLIGFAIPSQAIHVQ